ncbi:MAG: DNA topoisomerase IV subunit B, partial [Aquiluna sp.]
LVPGLELVAEGVGEKLCFKHDGGIEEYVGYLAKDAEVIPTKRILTKATFSETIPVLNEKTGAMESREVERECSVDIALRWGTGYETEVRSFVNIIATPKGGSHLSGFEQGLLKVFRAAIEANARKLKATGLKLERDDVMTGLTAVVTVSFPEPQFEGQTKETLGTPAIKGIVTSAISDYFEGYLAGKQRGTK